MIVIYVKIFKKKFLFIFFLILKICSKLYIYINLEVLIDYNFSLYVILGSYLILIYKNLIFLNELFMIMNMV